jgi:hypothetical protein
MGLDIHAYRNLKKLNLQLNEDKEAIDPNNPKETYEGDYVVPYNNSHFEDSYFNGLEEVPYSYDEEFSFHAGSYGGYSEFRRIICRFLELVPEEVNMWTEEEPKMELKVEGFYWNGNKGPFSELINFSDCEGTIGSEVSKKLLKDFEEYKSKAEKIQDHFGFLQRYNDWIKALTLASDNGCIIFC